MRLIPLLFILTLFAGVSSAQNNPWKAIKESQIIAEQSARVIFPSKYTTQHLDMGQLKSLLATAPQEAEFIGGEAGVELYFPLPDGNYSRFEVWEAPVMAPELTAQFPDIRSYAGRNSTGDYIRLSVSPKGFNGMVLPVDRSKTYFMDPYTPNNQESYICYAKADYFLSPNRVMECMVEGTEINDPEHIVMDRAGSCGNLRTYRLALACTGEYANYHGATGTNKAPALAAMNTSMTRVNGVFEIDCNLRMIIVANNLNVIYTNASTDPYTNNNGSSMLSQNISTCNAQIGSANYDIGHVFSTGGGGVAYLACVCGSSKAGGVTGQPNPINDGFDIDYVAHEMGHQFGAEHTQYNNCNRSNSSAMEPGSASSIMGYAGICAPDVQAHSDAYFHARSIGQIATFINGSGNACAVLVGNGNNAPTCNALVNKTIPKSTPFVLTATGSDPDSDPISYCWEQMNAYSNPAQPMPPTATNKSGPVFRTWNPSTSPKRYFPLFADALNGSVGGTWEKLPSVARTLNFRVTVRDNHANGGCTTEKDVALTVTANAGPFAITQPNTNVNWQGGSNQTVTWSVAGTTANGVNCANVNILISTDGGATFTTLLSNTPNDGTQSVTIPNVGTTRARILVESVGNYFYDVSNTNFTITATQPQPLTGKGGGNNVGFVVYPNPTSGQVQVTAPEAWNSKAITLRIWDLEGRLLIEDQNYVSGNAVDVTGLTKGSYQLELIQDEERLASTLIRQ